MTLPWQRTITILALDKRQHPMFRVQFISGGFNPNLLEDAKAFGPHLLKLEPQVVHVGVDNRLIDTLSSEKPPRREDAAEQDQHQSAEPGTYPAGDSDP